MADENDNLFPNDINKKSKTAGKYIRQLPLLEEAMNLQNTCDHTLDTFKETIVCAECGALWVK